MLSIKIAGSKCFVDQIKNQLEWMEREGQFIYTDDENDASIVVSEEEACLASPNVYVYIEVIRNGETGKLCAAQYIMGRQISAFPLADLPYVLQSTIGMIGLVVRSEKKLKDVSNKTYNIEEDNKHLLSNLGSFKKVQQNVMKEMSKIDGFSSEYVFLPKNEVSGDFLVTQKMPDGRTFIFLGDVTGHGFYSGAYASAMISAIRSYFDTCSMFGANLNQFAMYIARAAFYYHGGSEQSSCECVICEIDPSRNVANFVTFSGGNISPIIIKKSGKVKTVYSLLEDDSEESRTKNDETMKKITPRLGEPYYENNITFETMPGVFTERFCVGDTILFYTDGFSEMFSQVKKGLKDQAYVYGVDNMERAVKDAVSTKGNDPDVVVNAVISDISSYAVKGLSDSKRLENLIYDDATMFCIKREV